LLIFGNIGNQNLLLCILSFFSHIDKSNSVRDAKKEIKIIFSKFSNNGNDKNKIGKLCERNM